MALDAYLNNVQHEPIDVTASLTAALNRYYVNTASATYTDPTPVNGEGFIVFVRNGTATVGGTGYSVAGTIVYRYYHSGAWANYSYQVDSTFQPLDADLTAIAGLSPSNDDIIQRKSGAWTSRTMAQLAADLISIVDSTSTVWGIYKSGQYLSLPYTGLSTSGFAIDSLRAVPIAIEGNVTFSAIRIDVTTLVVGGYARVGIYSDNNGYPGALLTDAGAIDCSTTGLKEASISQSFTSATKRIWLAMNISSVSIGFRYPTGCPNTIGRTASGGSLTPNVYRVSSVYGALPSTYPAGALVEAASSQCPLIEIKVS